MAEDGKMFEPEWMRVVPKDKELRAFLRWKWLKEGWNWVRMLFVLLCTV